jgi:hypothetical protein
MKDKSKITGKVTIKVFDKDGNIKRFEPNFIQKLLGLPGRQMLIENHNIVTDEGDALIADLMADSPAKTKVNNTNGKIMVGTGWTGTTPKANTWLNTPTGTAEALDSTYPKVKGSFGAANDNVVQYRATFEAGDLNASGIDEVVLANAATDGAGEVLAYAEITPAVNITTADTLQVDWEITLLGA